MSRPSDRLPLCGCHDQHAAAPAHVGFVRHDQSACRRVERHAHHHEREHREFAILNGGGSLQLQDGLIWDIPIFGIFSDLLNTMAPGLGSSRASAGACAFGITNGVIRSNDLEIRSTAARLQYRGTVDFEGRVKARVEAGLLHDVRFVGPVVSTVLLARNQTVRIQGQRLARDPKAEPVYLIPKFMLLPFQMPFHPVRTLKGFLPEDLNGSRANSPPLVSPKQQ